MFNYITNILFFLSLVLLGIAPSISLVTMDNSCEEVKKNPLEITDYKFKDEIIF